MAGSSWVCQGSYSPGAHPNQAVERVGVSAGVEGAADDVAGAAQDRGIDQVLTARPVRRILAGIKQASDGTIAFSSAGMTPQRSGARGFAAEARFGCVLPHMCGNHRVFSALSRVRPAALRGKILVRPLDQRLCFSMRAQMNTEASAKSENAFQNPRTKLLHGVLFFVALLPLILIDPAILYLFWNWFAVKVGFRSLTYGYAFGLHLLLRFIISPGLPINIVSEKRKWPDNPTDLWRPVASAYLGRLFTLVVGAIIHLLLSHE